MFILIFSALFLQERIFLSQISGIAIGFGSLFMIIKSQGLHLDYSELFGVIAILVAAVMHALSYVITKQRGGDIGVVTFNTLPIGIAGIGLSVVGLAMERPDLAAVTPRSWVALVYLGLVASVGGFIVYFLLLKRLSPVVLSFVFIIFPVFAVVIGAWYEGSAISPELIGYTLLLLAGFAITKLPIEKLLTRTE
ncbi:carboxylate/amino acid/amine transporter [compost metagenome]